MSTFWKMSMPWGNIGWLFNKIIMDLFCVYTQDDVLRKYRLVVWWDGWSIACTSSALGEGVGRGAPHSQMASSIAGCEAYNCFWTFPETRSATFWSCYWTLFRKKIINRILDRFSGRLSKTIIVNLHQLSSYNRPTVAQMWTPSIQKGCNYNTLSINPRFNKFHDFPN